MSGGVSTTNSPNTIKLLASGWTQKTSEHQLKSAGGNPGVKNTSQRREMRTTCNHPQFNENSSVTPRCCVSPLRWDFAIHPLFQPIGSFKAKTKCRIPCGKSQYFFLR